jgi:hypothetical protein
MNVRDLICALGHHELIPHQPVYIVTPDGETYVVSGVSRDMYGSIVIDAGEQG